LLYGLEILLLVAASGTAWLIDRYGWAEGRALILLNVAIITFVVGALAIAAILWA
jgi:hypothetical protein